MLQLCSSLNRANGRLSLLMEQNNHSSMLVRVNSQRLASLQQHTTQKLSSALRVYPPAQFEDTNWMLFYTEATSKKEKSTWEAVIFVWIKTCCLQNAEFTFSLQEGFCSAE